MVSGAELWCQNNDGYGINLPRYYAQKIHFGFTLSGNTSDYRINTMANTQLPDTVINEVRMRVNTVNSKLSRGFAIGLVSDLRLQEYIRLRFTPNISFATRRIQYRLATAARDTFRNFEKTVESVLLVFPIETKIQSKRSGNFSSYIIGGGGYSLDLSARKVAGSATFGANQLNENLKVQRDDFFYSAGAGTDFYLKYFKMGLELKLLIGTKNLLKKENHIFANSIEKIRSRMVVFSITFEGS